MKNNRVFICIAIFIYTMLISATLITVVKSIYYIPKPYVETKETVYIIPWPWSLEINENGVISMTLNIKEGLK